MAWSAVAARAWATVIRDNTGNETTWMSQSVFGLTSIFETIRYDLPPQCKPAEKRRSVRQQACP